MAEYECSKCDKSFSSEEALEQHEQDYDHSKLEECSKCGEKFSSDENFREHRKKHWGSVRRTVLGDSYVLVGILLVGLVIAGGLGLNAVSDASGNGDSNPVSGDANVLEVTGGEFYFSPSNPEIEKGNKTAVKFTNTGSAPHDLRLTGIGKGTDTVRPGQSDSFTVNISKSRDSPLRFECTLPGHAERGMVGSFKTK